MAITDVTRMPGSFESHVEAANQAGIRSFQIREKSWSARKIFEETADLLTTLSEDTQLFINDRLDVVLALAHRRVGGHVGGHSLPWQAARRVVPADRLGVSTHSVDEANATVQAGALYAYLSPIFRPTSKQSDDRPFLGPEVFSLVNDPQRVLALGGVCDSTMPQLAEAGVQSAAALGACWGRDPDETFTKCDTLVKSWTLVSTL